MDEDLITINSRFAKSILGHFLEKKVKKNLGVDAKVTFLDELRVEQGNGVVTLKASTEITMSKDDLAKLLLDNS